MRDENRARRQDEIEAAAYALLEKKGYAGTSMQGIARQARCSNETLYSWYGDKRGLFTALVTRNAAEVRALLEEDLARGGDAMAGLERIAPKLLALLLGERAVALNRAAAADAGGELGAAISAAGRESVLPLIARTLERAREEGRLRFDAGAEAEAAGLFMDLLAGDLQIRRVIGRAPPPDEAFVAARARQALARLRRLLG